MGSFAMNVLRSGLDYLYQGQRIILRSPRLFALIAVLFSLPSLLAAFLAVSAAAGQVWSAPLSLALDSVTALVGPVVFMLAVGAAYREERPSLVRVVGDGLLWLPRYVWTNVHTSALFWIPVGTLLAFRGWLEQQLPRWDTAADLLVVAYGLMVGAVAIYLHTRTLLAPFLAVHSDLPGTQAAWESWRQSGQQLPLVMSTFLVSSAPFAPPLVLATILLFSGVRGPAGWERMLPHLLGVAVQLVRLTLIPASYLLYRDLWGAATRRRQAEGHPPLPWLVRCLLRLTAWIPPLGPVGRAQPAPASPRPEAEGKAPVAVDVS